MRALVFSSIVFIATGCAEDQLRPGSRLQPQGGISGRICDKETGEWVTNATVTADDAEGTSTSTGDDGSFNLDGLPPGEYTIIIEDEFGFSSRRTVVVREDQVTEIGGDVCAVERGHIDGRACDEAAESWVPNANVVLPLPNGDLTTITDEFGRFGLLDIPIGQHQVFVSTANGDFQEVYDVEVVPYDTVFAGDVSCGPLGAVHGRICGANNYWLVAARVAVELDDGTVVETQTDSDGYFTLTDVPAGPATIVVTKGSFSTTIDVTVIGDDTVMLEEPVCIPPTTRIAVVTGMYDSVEDVLTGLDFPIRATYTSSTPTIQDPEGNIDIIDGMSSFWVNDFLSDWAWLNEYQIIFFNCGLSDYELESPDTSTLAAIDNLRSFVSQGGSVYASDWAASVVMQSWPGHINFLGDDSDLHAPRKGASDSSMTGSVVDGSMQAALGQTTVDLNLNLPAWVVMDGMASQPSSLRVMVTSDSILVTDADGWDTTGHPDAPLLVQFDNGLGRVLYTSFHNEAQTTQDMKDILNFVVFEL